MDIQKKQATWNQERPLFELNFMHSHLLEYFSFNESTGDYELVEVTPNFVARDVVYEVLNTGWAMWLRAKCNAKSQAVPEGAKMVPKLSANYLFSKVPELGFKHKDEKDTVLYHLNYMASEFNAGAKSFVEQDHAKQQTMFEAQEQSHE